MCCSFGRSVGAYILPSINHTSISTSDIHNSSFTHLSTPHHPHYVKTMDSKRNLYNEPPRRISNQRRKSWSSKKAADQHLAQTLSNLTNFIRSALTVTGDIYSKLRITYGEIKLIKKKDLVDILLETLRTSRLPYIQPLRSHRLYI